MPRLSIVILEAAFVLCAAQLTAQQQPPPPAPTAQERQPPPRVPEGGLARRDIRTDPSAVEPLVHGPVHEAFAAPTPREAQPPSALTELPPDPLEESPPPAAPESDIAARWIPGYWGWDVREKGHVWVSGTWRSAPPEMEWIPGYWTKDRQECQWVSGFWARRGEEELAYVPSPPALREESPPAPPSEQHFWVPGNWQFVESEYRWKPGFWAENRDDFVWIPDCYTWTPRGYVFVRGFWDLPLESRGMLLAPLAVRGGALGRVAPTVAIDVREALVHWFVGPTLRHYYFGDYYDLPRGAAPVYSWYDFAAVGPRIDPMLAYYAANNAPFYGTLKTKHNSFKADSKIRPALTWSSYARSGAGGLAFPLSAQQLPAGIAPFAFAGDEFGAVTGYYRTAALRRMEFEQGAFIGASRAPVFVGLDTFLPPGHGGLPPGLAKKGLVPPGFGGAPPGQVKKYVESFGPIIEKPGKGKGGGGGKGKGKGR